MIFYRCRDQNLPHSAQSLFSALSENLSSLSLEDRATSGTIFCLIPYEEDLASPSLKVTLFSDVVDGYGYSYMDIFKI